MQPYPGSTQMPETQRPSAAFFKAEGSTPA
jgi:hypothetical protein